MYKCLSCGKKIEINIKATRKIQCPFCGYRIIEKMRPTTNVKVKAR